MLKQKWFRKVAADYTPGVKADINNERRCSNDSVSSVTTGLSQNVISEQRRLSTLMTEAINRISAQYNREDRSDLNENATKRLARMDLVTEVDLNIWESDWRRLLDCDDHSKTVNSSS
jgi:hypothetical protein